MAQAIEKGEPGFIVARQGAKPLPDIDLDHTWWSPAGFPNDCLCNECGHKYADFATRQLPACPKCSRTHTDQAKFDASLKSTPPGGNVYSLKTKKCFFPGCTFAFPGPGHDHQPKTQACSDGHDGCRGDDAFVEGGGLCYCTNVRGVHGRRVSCPPKEG